MKLAFPPTSSAITSRLQVHLPYGLIGLPELQRFDLAPISGSWPLLSLLPVESAELNFVAIEPHTLIGGYDPEINDDDAELLRIESPDDLLILNLVTVHSLLPQFVTVNLIGPVLLNRHTSIGKQSIIANFEKYSSVHVLVEERAQDRVA